MTRVAVFGASGRVGRLVVRLAADDGHEVVAFGRDRRKLYPGRLGPAARRRLKTVVGELDDPVVVGLGVADADVVIAALGPGARVRQHELTDGMRTIIGVMREAGVRRLVALSTASVRDPGDRFDLRYCLLVSAVRCVFPAAYAQIRRIGVLVRASQLDWTLVRVGLLTNGRARSVRRGSYGRGEVGVRISRMSLARFLLATALSHEHVREAPAVSN